MGKFKPQITVLTRDSENEYRMGKKRSPYKTIQYPTYAELRKNIKRHLEEDLGDTVSVSRSRRGEWGEWYENWQLDHERKPVIIDQGWM